MALKKIKIGDPSWGRQVNDQFMEIERRLRRQEQMTTLALLLIFVQSLTDLAQSLWL